MRASTFPVCAGIAALLLSVLACGGSTRSVYIADAWMATDETGEHRTTVFSQTDDFRAFVDLRSAPDDTKLRAVWTGLLIEGEVPGTLLSETDFRTGAGVVSFHLNNDQLWPIGSYQVDIYLNDSPARTLNFEVQ